MTRKAHTPRNAAQAPAFYAFDADYLYFRYRMNGDPTGSGGFAQYAWTALMQVPSGNPFQYQYQLSLNGQTDTIEVWENTNAQDIDFSPLFHDDAEVKLHGEPYGTLARVVRPGRASAATRTRSSTSPSRCRSSSRRA